MIVYCYYLFTNVYCVYIYYYVAIIGLALLKSLKPQGASPLQGCIESVSPTQFQKTVHCLLKLSWGYKPNASHLVALYNGCDPGASL